MATPARRTVKALAAYEPGLDVKPYEYVSRPLGVGDVEIAISHCGICGSDLHTISGGWGAAKYPVVPGHEIVGTVTAKGQDVTDLNIGDRVGVGAIVHACLDKTTCLNCANDDDPLCSKIVLTYNGLYEDGEKSYGGYADFVRVNAKFAFKIPDEIPSDLAAPLLCAGATVYSPLKLYVEAGMRVGVVGIGGLGHLALQFAKALDATPVAFSQSPSKEQDARTLGAEDFIVFTDPADAVRAKQSVDVLLLTADATNQDYDLYIQFVKRNGKIVIVGVPDDEVKFKPFPFVMSKVSIVGSAIGSIPVIKEMLELATKKKIFPVIQKMPMSEANKGLALVDQGKVRFRVVLEN